MSRSFINEELLRQVDTLVGAIREGEYNLPPAKQAELLMMVRIGAELIDKMWALFKDTECPDNCGNPCRCDWCKEYIAIKKAVTDAG